MLGGLGKLAVMVHDNDDGALQCGPRFGHAAMQMLAPSLAGGNAAIDNAASRTEWMMMATTTTTTMESHLSKASCQGINDTLT